MLPVEIVDRTFKIEYGGGLGTAFALDIDNKQYLVTAKHCVKDIAGKSEIKLFRDGKWNPLAVELVGHSDVDISVLAPSTQLARKEAIVDTAVGGFLAGQDAFFAGFPLGLEGANVESEFPAPLIKKAIISGKASGSDDSTVFYLDGHNNPGFSGGPVYLRLPGRKEYVITMVISGYTSNLSAVVDKDGRPTLLNVWENSGIIQAFSIKHALEQIRHTPIGLKLE